MVAQPSSSGPVFTEGGLPTPQPMGVPSFGDTFAAAPPAAMAPPKPGLAGLLERQPGLKYVFAALAIVVLIILLVLVILRGEREEADEPASPAQAEPGKVVEPEAVPAETPSPPPVAEEAKATPPLPSSPPVAEEPKVAPPPPSPPPAGKRGFRRGGRRAAIRAPRPPKDRSTASPPRLSGARPNPFEDSKNVSQSQITAVVRNPANQAALKSCYERALKVDNRLTSGRIDVTVSIGMSGAVRRVVINAPSSFILVEPCIKAAVKRWKFPANNEEYATSFPLILQGGM
jgi:hypothetical protein